MGSQPRIYCRQDGADHAVHLSSGCHRHIIRYRHLHFQVKGHAGRDARKHVCQRGEVVLLLHRPAAERRLVGDRRGIVAQLAQQAVGTRRAAVHAAEAHAAAGGAGAHGHVCLGLAATVDGRQLVEFSKSQV